MKKILAFAGSNSSNSINKELVRYTASLLNDVQVTVLDLNDFELPIYSTDLEKKIGIPQNVKKFHDHIANTDGIILSLAENNGAYSAVFKNLFDWLSRHEAKLFMGKPMLLMATSPGERGGASVLEMAQSRFPYHNARIIASFSLPSFQDNFKDRKITDKALNDSLLKALGLLDKQF